MTPPGRPDTPSTEAITEWESAAQTAWGRYLTAAETRVLNKALDLASPDGGAMEVGCEGGRWSRVLLQRRGSVTCTDTNAEVLNLCARRLPDARCVLTGAEDEQLPAHDGELGLLLVYEVVPVTNADWFPTEAARVLRRGGILVFSHHNPVSIRALGYRAASLLGRRSKSWAFYNGPSYASLRASMRQAGLEIVHQEGLAWMPFSRKSDSRLIQPAVRLESALGLRHLCAVSPWVLALARRS